MSKIPAKRPPVPASPAKVVFRPPRSNSTSQQRNSINGSFKIGDRVVSGGKTGSIAFIGSTKFAEGEWIGISLDEPVGKNDGSYQDTRYFETDPNHGLFCRPDKVQHVSINGMRSQRNSLDINLRTSVTERTSRIPSASKEDFAARGSLSIGDRVMINGTKVGTLQYVGRIHIEPGIWCGIKLDGPHGKHDGKVDGKRYFHCPNNYGIFAPVRQVEKIQKNSVDPRLSVISTGYTSDDLQLSRLSSSSDSLDEEPIRHPKVVRQTSFSKELTPIEKTFSPQIAQLQEQIREKDALIGKLEEQITKNRIEDALTTKMIEDMQNKMQQLQEKYDAAENENFNLIREQCELKQRLDDLQVELTVPDDHAVLSPEEYDAYEKSIVRIQQLEEELRQRYEEDEQIEEYQSKLDQATSEIEALRLELQQNQAVESNSNSEEYEQQIEEFKGQIEALQLELQQSQTVENNSNSEEYEQQIEEYKAQIEALRQAKSSSEEDQQAREELLTKLNNLRTEKENEQAKSQTMISTLKENCQELQREIDELNQREISAHKNLHQSEAQFDHRMDEYRRKLEETVQQIDQLKCELDQSKMEKSQLSQTISQLTNQLETLQNQNQNESETLEQSQAQLVQSLAEIENLQKKLSTLEEDKVNSENRLNQKIDAIKTHFEELQAKQELQTNETLQERESALQQAQLTIQDLKSQLQEFMRQKGRSNDTMDSLTQELQALKAELDDRGRARNELEILYQSQLDEQHRTSERQYYERIESLKRDHEVLLNEQKQKEKALQAQYDQEFDEYQKNLELALRNREDIQSEYLQLQEQKDNSEKSFNEQIQSLQKDFQNQIKQFEQEKSELKQQIAAHEQRLKENDSILYQMAELRQQIDTLTQENAKLKQELEDVRNAHDPNEIESLTEEITTLQEMNTNLLKARVEKQQEYEMKIALMKSEFMVEMENTRLDHDQEVLRLKNLLAKTPPAKGKH